MFHLIFFILLPFISCWHKSILANVLKLYLICTCSIQGVDFLIQVILSNLFNEFIFIFVISLRMY